MVVEDLPVKRTKATVRQNTVNNHHPSVADPTVVSSSLTSTVAVEQESRLPLHPTDYSVHPREKFVD
jgi:hypothetical protein